MYFIRRSGILPQIKERVLTRALSFYLGPLAQRLEPTTYNRETRVRFSDGPPQIGKARPRKMERGPWISCLREICSNAAKMKRVRIQESGLASGWKVRRQTRAGPVNFTDLTNSRNLHVLIWSGATMCSLYYFYSLYGGESCQCE